MIMISVYKLVDVKKLFTLLFIKFDIVGTSCFCGTKELKKH
jgi:hypothetical protein